jgi:hypothetical protein
VRNIHILYFIGQVRQDALLGDALDLLDDRAQGITGFEQELRP